MPEQQCREMLATHFWVCRVGKGTFSKPTLCPCETSASHRITEW